MKIKISLNFKKIKKDCLLDYLFKLYEGEGVIVEKTCLFTKSCSTYQLLYEITIDDKLSIASLIIIY